MAKTCLVIKQRLEPKYKVRKYHRCKTCGRSGGYIRKFSLCRICFRELAVQGLIPGVMKSSW